MKRFAVLLLIIPVFAMSAAGCVKKYPDVGQAPLHRSFFAMDTIMELTIYESRNADSPESYDGDDPGKVMMDEAQKIICDLEGRISVTDPESVIHKLNSGMEVPIDEATRKLLSRAVGMCELTGGNLDISIYPLVRLWGFTTGEYRIPSSDQIREALENVGYEALTEMIASAAVQDASVLPDGMQIDLGAVAKGYAAEKLKSHFVSKGVKSGVISLGGNILVIGKKPDGSKWRIAIADPYGDGFAGTVSVFDRSVVTSGVYERYFEDNGRRYSHIIDPSTGCPVDNKVMSVTVIGDDGMYCDALSTALTIMGEDAAADYWRLRGRDFEFILINSDHKMIVTGGLKDIFKADDKYGPDAVRYIE
ncbi:MAG: FAD:protein FMN transferase [Lachnospiraceae bacterium]|nr:FAD:protein FMN transferase [Lachnospiraceae bacterium]